MSQKRESDDIGERWGRNPRPIPVVELGSISTIEKCLRLRLMTSASMFGLAMLTKLAAIPSAIMSDRARQD